MFNGKSGHRTKTIRRSWPSPTADASKCRHSLPWCADPAVASHQAAARQDDQTGKPYVGCVVGRRRLGRFSIHPAADTMPATLAMRAPHAAPKPLGYAIGQFGKDHPATVTSTANTAWLRRISLVTSTTSMPRRSRKIPPGKGCQFISMVEHGGHGGKLLKAIAVYTTDHGPKRWMGPDAATSKPRSPSSGLASANADAPEGAKDSLGIAAIALLVAQPRTS